VKCLPAAVVALAVLFGCSPITVEPHLAPDQSWVAPEAKSVALLYISDWSDNKVDIYDYATKAKVGDLTGFKGPYGQCVDAKSHVWITELNGFQVSEYAHGGAKPLRRLRTSGYPIGCAVDPNTGDLAVANFSTAHGTGNVEVWTDARGKPAIYHPGKLWYLWPPAYDGKSNLFVEGQVKNGPYGLSELPHGGDALRAIAFTGASLHYAGGVFWDGKYLGVTDQNSDSDNTTVIYRTSVTGVAAKIIGRTHLTDRCHNDYADVVDPFPVPDANGHVLTIVGGNLWCEHRFGFWSYPSGGVPAHLLANAPTLPYGQAVSPPVK
jgi:hypothetical protein